MENKELDKCPGHGRDECVACLWPRKIRGRSIDFVIIDELAEKPKAKYTAVDMATAAAEGFRDGAKSVVVELPPRIERTSQNMLQEDVADMQIWNRCWDQCKAAIIAAGGSVKE